MCVSAHRADFTGTFVSLYETMHREHGLIQVLGYSNNAQNLSSGPNAMIIHFPSAEPMSEKNFIEHNCPNLHQDMKSAVEPVTRGGEALSLGFSKAVIFEYDIYIVILGPTVEDCVKLLPLVAEERRPTLSSWVAPFYGQELPRHSVGLFCFNNRDAQKAKPVLVWYKPWNFEFMCLPSLDCHTGDVPNVNGLVEVDHWIFLAHDKMYGGHQVFYQDPDAERIADYLPKRIIGRYFGGRLYSNGDFAYKRDHVMGGNLGMMRRLRPADYR